MSNVDVDDCSTQIPKIDLIVNQIHDINQEIQEQNPSETVEIRVPALLATEHREESPAKLGPGFEPEDIASKLSGLHNRINAVLTKTPETRSRCHSPIRTNLSHASPTRIPMRDVSPMVRTSVKEVTHEVPHVRTSIREIVRESTKEVPVMRTSIREPIRDTAQEITLMRSSIREPVRDSVQEIPLMRSSIRDPVREASPIRSPRRDLSSPLSSHRSHVVEVVKSTTPASPGRSAIVTHSVICTSPAPLKQSFGVEQTTTTTTIVAEEPAFEHVASALAEIEMKKCISSTINMADEALKKSQNLRASNCQSPGRTGKSVQFAPVAWSTPTRNTEEKKASANPSTPQKRPDLTVITSSPRMMSPPRTEVLKASPPKTNYVATTFSTSSNTAPTGAAPKYSAAPRYDKTKLDQIIARIEQRNAILAQSPTKVVSGLGINTMAYPAGQPRSSSVMKVRFQGV